MALQKSLFFIPVLFLNLFPIFACADVYRCDIDGRPVFSDQPCSQEQILQRGEGENAENTGNSATISDSDRWWQEKLAHDAEVEKKQQNEARHIEEIRKKMESWSVYTGNSGGLYNHFYDGRIPAIEKYLQRHLKDPESLRFNECSKVYTDGAHFKALCEYRAKNSFGGYVVAAEVFHMYGDGDVYKVAPYTGKPIPLE